MSFMKKYHLIAYCLLVLVVVVGKADAGGNFESRLYAGSLYEVMQELSKERVSSQDLFSGSPDDREIVFESIYKKLSVEHLTKRSQGFADLKYRKLLIEWYVYFRDFSTFEGALMADVVGRCLLEMSSAYLKSGEVRIADECLSKMKGLTAEDIVFLKSGSEQLSGNDSLGEGVKFILNSHGYGDPDNSSGLKQYLNALYGKVEVDKSTLGLMSNRDRVALLLRMLETDSILLVDYEITKEFVVKKGELQELNKDARYFLSIVSDEKLYDLRHGVTHRRAGRREIVDFLSSVSDEKPYPSWMLPVF